MPQTPETITLSTFSMTGLALYGYKLAKVPFLHYFWQQFYLGAKDNQKACIQSTIVILTLLRLHHMKKNRHVVLHSPKHQIISEDLRFSSDVFREIESIQNGTKGTKICLKILFIYT